MIFDNIRNTMDGLFFPSFQQYFVDHLASFYDYTDSLPAYRAHIEQLKDGVSYTFTGNILPNCERFSINFMLANDRFDVALHINPRLPQNYIVRNSRVKDVWGTEEVSSALPFSLHRGADLSIQVLVTKTCYMISVNGLHFAKFNHRLPYTAVSIIEVKGDVENINVERSEVTNYPQPLPNSKPEDVRIALQSLCNEDEADTDALKIPYIWLPRGTYDKKGLELPYYGSLESKSLCAGRCLRIVGRVKLLPHSFYINLQHGSHMWPHPTIAFHFNPRFSKKSGAFGKAIVCRNAWYNGAWAKEERSELVMDFLPGKSFILVFGCKEESFEVYVNHKFVLAFKYKMNPEVVDTIYIQGDIKLWDVAVTKF